MIRREGQVTDEHGRFVEGASIYVFKQDGTAATLTSDGVASLAQPVKTDQFGVYAYYADENYYTEHTYFGGKLEHKEFFPLGSPGADLSLRADLAATTGAGLVGTTSGATVQARLDAIAGDAGLRTDLAATTGATLVGMAGGGTVQSNLGSRSFGEIGTGDTAALTLDKTASLNLNGASSFRGLVNRVTISGANGTTAQVNAQNSQTEITHTAGTIAFAYGIQGYNRLGLAGSTTGNVTTSRGIEWHTSNESTGTITDAFNFLSGDVDLADGTGPIANMIGFRSANLGHATRVTAAAVGFDCANMTAGAPVTAAFRSAMASGTNKWGFLGTGNAVNAFAGNVRIGDNTVPANALEVRGYSKLTSDGTITITGAYHETLSSNNDFIAHFRNTHATAPHGIRTRFTGASPNNTVQYFALFEDSVGSRCVIWSNGNLANSNNVYGAISDRRLKVRIKNATPQLDDIRALKVRKYRLKSDRGKGPEMIGVIAQEAEEVSPGLVFENPDGMKGVNYSVLYMKAVKALQELADQVDELRAEVAALKKGK